MLHPKDIGDGPPKEAMTGSSVLSDADLFALGFDLSSDRWATRIRRALQRQNGGPRPYPEAPSAAPLQAGHRIGPYELIEEIGKGGMGSVWRARRADAHFDRVVALKAIKRGMDTDEIMRRFRLERQVLAKLEHPHIARLYEGGAADDGRPYLVMEYVDGMPVDRYCDEHNLGIAKRLELFGQICSAVEYAHQRLVAHRDLKPGNILVTDDGTAKLLDFGIAKILSDDDPGSGFTLTQAPQRVLTPRYASPEQIRGTDISTTTDVYSLGVILYELLTGRHPFEGVTDGIDLERAICTVDPVKPSAAVAERKSKTARKADPVASRSPDSLARLQRTLRGDLDTILMTALAREPQRRYASVQQLAADLHAFLRHEPIKARPDSWRYRSAKFIRRHRAAVAGSAVLTIGLLGATIFSSIMYGRAVHANEEAEWRAYVASVSAAEAALHSRDMEREVQKYLDDAPEHLRAWEWHYLKNANSGAVWDRTKDNATACAFSPDDRLLVVGRGSRQLSLRDARTGRLLFLGESVKNHHLFRCLTFSPDGAHLASGSKDGVIILWELTRNEAGFALEQKARLSPKLKHRIEDLEYSPDGTRLASIVSTGRIVMWDADAGKQVWVAQGPAQQQRGRSHIAFDGNGRRLFSVATEPLCHVWDVENGEALGTIAESDTNLTDIAISADGNTLIVLTAAGDFERWSLPLGKCRVSRTPLATEEIVVEKAISLSDDGRWAWLQIASAGRRRNACANSSTGEIVVLGKRPQERSELAFSHDGAMAAFANWLNPHCDLWHLTGPSAIRRLEPPYVKGEPPEWWVNRNRALCVATTRDGNLIATGGDRFSVCLWEGRTGIYLGQLETPGWSVRDLKIDDGGRWLVCQSVSAGSRALLSVWDLRTHQILLQFDDARPPGRTFHVTAIDPQGRWFAYPNNDDGVHVRSLPAGDLLHSFPPPAQFPLWSCAASPDGRKLAVASGPTAVETVCHPPLFVWNVESGELIWTLTHIRASRRVLALAFSPDGQRLATVRQGWNINCWDARTGEFLHRGMSAGRGFRGYAVAWSPNGSRLLRASTTRYLYLWDARRWETIVPLELPGSGRVYDVEFDPQGRWIAAALQSGDFIVADARSAVEQLPSRTVRRLHDELGDLDAVDAAIERDRWLNEAQRAEAHEIVQFLRNHRHLAGPPPGD